ncbi:hypothetical protein [Pelagibacterium lacus]|uniref:hypothetical protein n=1 Tax=Pelagibacterium lacus TaxID=2282655 RepID=UPI0011C080F2|nr:hypothetical protein [Pelagibacterium lacus]
MRWTLHYHATDSPEESEHWWTLCRVKGEAAYVEHTWLITASGTSSEGTTRYSITQSLKRAPPEAIAKLAEILATEDIREVEGLPKSPH